MLLLLPFYVISNNEDPNPNEGESIEADDDVFIRIYLIMFGRNPWFTVPENPTAEIDVDVDPGPQYKDGLFWTHYIWLLDNAWREQAECNGVELPERDYSMVVADIGGDGTGSIGDGLMGQYLPDSHTVLIDPLEIEWIASEARVNQGFGAANVEDSAINMLTHESTHGENRDQEPILAGTENDRWNETTKRFKDVWGKQLPLIGNGRGSAMPNRRYGKRKDDLSKVDSCSE